MLSSLKEDGAIYEINSTLAVVQTLDFITPVVNDPYYYGAIAAANAISDIYAVGAKPVFALNIVGYPVKSLALNILEEILTGGADKAKEAGVSIAGGHSVDDNAPKYGMAVTGFLDPSKIIKKQGASPGDVLILTKPIGTGILTTAIDRGLAGPEVEVKVSEIMAHLNKGASEAMVEIGVHACTDVTGFGLLGHLYEMMIASGYSAEILLNDVPVIPEAREFIKSGTVPAGTHNNYRFIRESVNWKGGITEENRLLLCDAQTSGGLLMAVPEEKADQLVLGLTEKGCLAAAKIGVVTEKKKRPLEVIY